MSIRRVSKVLEVLQFQERLDNTMPEDQWMSGRLETVPNAKMCPPDKAKEFAVADVWHEWPLGFHVNAGGLADAVWRPLERRRKIYEYCPEVKIIMDMALDREKCSAQIDAEREESQRYLADEGDKERIKAEEEEAEKRRLEEELRLKEQVKMEAVKAKKLKEAAKYEAAMEKHKSMKAANDAKKAAATAHTALPVSSQHAEELGADLKASGYGSSSNKGDEHVGHSGGSDPGDHLGASGGDRVEAGGEKDERPNDFFHAKTSDETDKDSKEEAEGEKNERPNDFTHDETKSEKEEDDKSAAKDDGDAGKDDGDAGFEDGHDGKQLEGDNHDVEPGLNSYPGNDAKEQQSQGEHSALDGVQDGEKDESEGDDKPSTDTDPSDGQGGAAFGDEHPAADNRDQDGEKEDSDHDDKNDLDTYPGHDAQEAYPNTGHSPSEGLDQNDDSKEQDGKDADSGSEEHDSKYTAEPVAPDEYPGREGASPGSLDEPPLPGKYSDDE